MPSLRFAVWIAAAMVAVTFSASAANDWLDLATVSMTDPVTPKLKNRYVCYTDGRNIRCDDPGLYVSTGGLIGINTNNPNAQLDVYGTVSATNFVGDGSGLTGISTQGDRIVSGTAPFTQMLAVSDSRYISITQGGANTAWFDPTRGLVTLGVSSTGVISGTGGYFNKNVMVASQPNFFGFAIGNEAGVLRWAIRGNNAESGGNTGQDLTFVARKDDGAFLSDVLTLQRSTGNVGVGVSAPIAALQVSGTFSVSSSAYVNSPTMYVDALGRVGIGVMPSSSVLAGHGGLHIQNSGPSGYSYSPVPGLLVENNGSSPGYFVLQTMTRGGGKALNVDNTGRVGISNTNPVAKLDVNGTISASDAIQVSGSSLTCGLGLKGAIRYSNTSNTLEYCNSVTWVPTGNITDTSLTAFTVTKNAIQTGIAAGSVVTWEAAITNNGGAFNLSTERFTAPVSGYYYFNASLLTNNDNSTGDFQIYKNGSATGLRGYGSNNLTAFKPAVAQGVLYLSAGDYVDVRAYAGTQTAYGGAGSSTSTFSGFLLNGGATGGGGGTATPAGGAGDIQFNDGTNLAADTGQLFWDATNKRLGIGTSAPGYPLHVSASSGGSVAGFSTAASDVNTYISVRNGVTNHTVGVDADNVAYDFTSGAYKIFTGGANERLRVASGGNVGISTQSPTATLQVSGSFIVSTSGQTTTPTLYVGTNGRVGVGTSNPFYDFSVNGNVYVGGAARTIFKDTNSYLNFLAGGADVDNPYWRGIHFAVPATLTAGASQYFPRVGVYWNYDNTANPTNATFNYVAGNSGPISTSLLFGTQTGGNISFQTSNTERLRLTAGGSIGVGTINPAVSLSVIGEVQVSNSGALCTNGLKGAIRYSNTSNTLEYCNSVAWVPTGNITDTSLTAFTVTKDSVQSGVGVGAVVTWDTAITNNGGAFDLSTERFTAPVNGYYFLIASLLSGNDGTSADVKIYKNGVATGLRGHGTAGAASYKPSTAQGVLYLAAGDYVDVRSSQASQSFYGALGASVSTFSGFLLNAGATGSGGGGTATPAGGAGDIQFNDGGNLAADTGQLFWDASNNRLGIGTAAPTAGLHVSGTMVVSGSDIGLDAGRGLVSSAGGRLATGPGGSTFGAYAGATSGANIFQWFTSDSTQVGAIRANGYMGIGTTNPSEPLHVGNGTDGGRLFVGEDGSNRRGLLIAANKANELSGATYPPYARIAAYDYASGTSIPLAISPHPNAKVSIGKLNPQAVLDVAGTISASDAIQVSGSSLTCNSGLKGAMRYSNTSSTIEYCQGTAWVSMGPSATDVPAFFVELTGGNQVVPTSTMTKVNFNNVVMDTYGAWDSTQKRFQPTVRGKYLITANVTCWGDTGYCIAVIFKNGSRYVQNQNNSTSGTKAAGATAIVDMNGTTDYIEGWGYNGGGTNIYGSLPGYTYLTGALIASGNGLAGGGGGTGSPAGSAGDIQYNDGSNLAADTGQLFWDATNNRLGIGTNVPSTTLDVSGSVGNMQVTSDGAHLRLTRAGNNYIQASSQGGNLFFGVNGNADLSPALFISSAGKVGISTTSPATQLDVNGEIKVGSTGLACSSGVSGAIRYSNTSSTIEYCQGTAWVSMGPSATTVAFQALRNTSMSSGGTITYSSEITDTQNAFNPATGVFTAPVSGVYLFSWGAIGASTPDVYRMQFRKNGSTLSGGELRIDTTATGADLQSGDKVFLVPMSAGETAAIYLVSDGGAALVSDANNWIYFGGALMTGGGGSGGGGATPAGSSNDVQYNSSGVLAADTGNFTYASGLLTAPTISTGGMTVTGQVSATYVSSSVVQVGSSSLTCGTNLKGAMRYSTTSSTIEYCQGSAWTSMGPSATNVPGFLVHRNGSNQTLSTGVITKFNATTKVFDTTGDFNLTTDRFTPTLAGQYIFVAAASCAGPNGDCATGVRKNGTDVSWDWSEASGYAAAKSAVIVNMNGTTDYVEMWIENDATTTVDGSTQTTYFAGSLLSSGNGLAGGGGGATPAGSTGDIQFNNAGALAADTGQLFWDATNNRLGIGTGSPAYPLDVNGVVQATNFVKTSDRRLKTNILQISSGLAVVEKLNPVTFNWKKDGSPSAGLIAQDVAKLIPTAVVSNSQGILSVDYEQTIPYLIRGMQELKAANDNLARENETLRGRLERVERLVGGAR